MKTFAIYKPYGMLSQFTKEMDYHQTLADLEFDFEKDVYPIGRLDRDSEGLLLLSNNKTLTSRILEPSQKIKKTYLAQVEGVPNEKALLQLERGILLKINKKEFQTSPSIVRVLPESEIHFPERNPPIRKRKNKPTSWVEISIVEGKNRQVRKMFAHVQFPVLRLIRVGIGGLRLGEGLLTTMQEGNVLEINTKVIFE